MSRSTWIILGVVLALILDLIVILLLRQRRSKRGRSRGETPTELSPFEWVLHGLLSRLPPFPSLVVPERFKGIYVNDPLPLLMGASGIVLILTGWGVQNLTFEGEGGLLLIGLGVLMGVVSAAGSGTDAKSTRLLSWLTSRVGLQEYQGILILVAIGFSLAARFTAGNGKQALSPLHGAFWAAGILLVLLGTRPLSNPEDPRRSDPLQLLIVFGIAAAAFLIRAVNIDQLPTVMGGDEGAVGLEAWRFVTGSSENILGEGWFTFPAFYFWLASGFQRLLGPTVEGIRMISAVGGGLAVAATYWTVSRFFGRFAGWISAILLSGMHLHVMFSRLALNNIWDSFFIMLVLGAFWWGWMEGRSWGFILAGLGLGFAQYFYLTSRLIPLYLLLWIPFLHLEIPLRRRLRGVTLAGLVALVTILPLALFYLDNPNLFFARFIHVSNVNPKSFGELLEALRGGLGRVYLRQFQDTLLGFLWLPSLGFYRPGVALLRTVPAVLFLLGLLGSIRNIRKPGHSILVIVFFSALLVGTFSIEPPNSQRLTPYVPVLVAFMAVRMDMYRVGLSAITRRRLAEGILLLAAISITAADLVFLTGILKSRRGYGDESSFTSWELVPYLQSAPPGTKAYFIGADYMEGFYINPSLTYRLPHISGHDLIPPLDLEGDPSQIEEPWVFIILGHRYDLLGEIRAQYPGGDLDIHFREYGPEGFLLYSSPYLFGSP